MSPHRLVHAVYQVDWTDSWATLRRSVQSAPNQWGAVASVLLIVCVSVQFLSKVPALENGAVPSVSPYVA
jgi:hypothetical protein